MNLKEAIVFAQDKFKDQSIASASLDAEVLLLASINHKLKTKNDKSWLYLNFGKYVLSSEEEKVFKGWVSRREKKEPVAYITNRKEFYGLDFFVDKNVLIPRPETELLVDNSLEIIKGSDENFALLDIGTGSGCIVISTLKEAISGGFKNRLLKVYANDISKEAIKVAKSNAGQNRLLSKITFLQCDLTDALTKIRNHKDVIITANLPYISEKDYAGLGPSVKNFEPKGALTTTENGLYHIYRLLENFAVISQDFHSFYLLLEADPSQTKAIENFAGEYISCKTEIVRDIRGKKRIIKISPK